MIYGYVRFAVMEKSYKGKQKCKIDVSINFPAPKSERVSSLAGKHVFLDGVKRRVFSKAAG